MSISSEESSSSSDDRSQTLKRKRKFKSCADSKAPKKKRRKLPSLKSISGLFDDCEKKTDQNDTSKHQGKHRRYDHEKGNWSVHVYIPIHKDLKALFDHKLFGIINQKSESNQIHRMDEYHISLSICQPIRQHQISHFVESITKTIANSNQKRFDITFQQLKYFQNETKNRYFATLLIDHGKDHILHLIDLVNQAMTKWGLRKFYDDPQPHISFIWSLKELQCKDSKLTQDMNLAISTELSAITTTMTVDRVTIKIGHRLYSVPLRA
eukprot:495383_1